MAGPLQSRVNPVRVNEPDDMRARTAILIARDNGMINSRWAVDSRDPAQLETLYRTLWPVTEEGQDHPVLIAQMRREIAWATRTRNQGRTKQQRAAQAAADQALYRELWPPTVDGTPDSADDPVKVQIMHQDIAEGRRLPADGGVHYLFEVTDPDGTTIPVVLPEDDVPAALFLTGLVTKGVTVAEKLQYRTSVLPHAST